VLNVRPNDLIDRTRGLAPPDGRITRSRLLRRIPPSWRTCRLTMSRAHFLGIAGVWIGVLAVLLAVALTVRWS
jgi:hypothetical protein